MSFRSVNCCARRLTEIDGRTEVTFALRATEHHQARDAPARLAIRHPAGHGQYRRRSVFNLSRGKLFRDLPCIIGDEHTCRDIDIEARTDGCQPDGDNTHPVRYWGRHADGNNRTLVVRGRLAGRWMSKHVGRRAPRLDGIYT